MEKRINKKKIVSICPSRVARSQCPSIRKTRQIRRELFKLQRDPAVHQKTIEKFRIKLKKKKNQGIAIDCNGCVHNISQEPIAAADSGA